MVSIFLSNTLELLQSAELLFLITNKVIQPQFIEDSKLILAIHKYDLWWGYAFMGGLFPFYLLLKKHEYMMIYDCIKRALERHNYMIFRTTLHVVAKALGRELEASIKRIVNVMFALLGTPNIPLCLPFPLPVPTVCPDKPLHMSPIPDLNLPTLVGSSPNDNAELTVVSRSLSPISWHVDCDGWVIHIPTAPPKGWEDVWFLPRGPIGNRHSE